MRDCSFTKHPYKQLEIRCNTRKQRQTSECAMAITEIASAHSCSSAHRTYVCCTIHYRRPLYVSRACWLFYRSVGAQRVNTASKRSNRSLAGGDRVRCWPILRVSSTAYQTWKSIVLPGGVSSDDLLGHGVGSQRKRICQGRGLGLPKPSPPVNNCPGLLYLSACRIEFLRSSAVRCHQLFPDTRPPQSSIKHKIGFIVTESSPSQQLCHSP